MGEAWHVRVLIWDLQGTATERAPSLTGKDRHVHCRHGGIFQTALRACLVLEGASLLRHVSRLILCIAWIQGNPLIIDRISRLDSRAFHHPPTPPTLREKHPDRHLGDAQDRHEPLSTQITIIHALAINCSH